MTAVPRSRPDGASVAFLRPDDRGRRQIWLISAHGGEANQLTCEPGGVTEFAWSPDSATLAFISDVDPDRLPDDHDYTKYPQARVVTRIRYRADSVGWRGNAFRCLFAVDAATGAARQIIGGEGTTLTRLVSRWQQNSVHIQPPEDKDTRSFTEAYVVSAGGGEVDAGLRGWHSGRARLVSRRRQAGGNRLGGRRARRLLRRDVLPAGAPEPLLEGSTTVRLRHLEVFPNLGSAEFAGPPTTGVVFLADAHGESYICEAPVSGAGARKVAGGGAQFSQAAFDASGRIAVVSERSPTTWDELRLLDAKDGSRPR